MTQPILKKFFYQLIIGCALAFLYMQIRPIPEYTLAWPFAALGGIFLCLAWFSYLKYDKLSLFKVTDQNQKQKEREQISSKFRLKGIMDYVNAPIYGDGQYTDKQKLKIKITANTLTGLCFIILTFIF